MRGRLVFAAGTLAVLVGVGSCKDDVGLTSIPPEPERFIAFLSGSLVGVAMLARHGAKGRKKGVPFAPFLALGGIAALLAGHQLIHLYTHHFV